MLGKSPKELALAETVKSMKSFVRHSPGSTYRRKLKLSYETTGVSVNGFVTIVATLSLQLGAVSVVSLFSVSLFSIFLSLLCCLFLNFFPKWPF